MGGDTTYQALERLTYLSDRDALRNGLVIAGQPYYDVFFTGGSISNVTLTDCTINGLYTGLNLDNFTASGDITATSSDSVIVVNKTVGEDTAVNFSGTPATNQILFIKDGKGDADTHNITINLDIDAGSSYVLGSPYGWIFIIWNEDAGVWNQLG